MQGHFTRAEIAVLLGVSPQRVSAIARRDGWEGRRIGRSWLYAAEDVERSIVIAQAQKAWRRIGIPTRLWGAKGLADPDEIIALSCPVCGGAAYSPAGETHWAGAAACSVCEWTGAIEDQDDK